MHGVDYTTTKVKFKHVHVYSLNRTIIQNYYTALDSYIKKLHSVQNTVKHAFRANINHERTIEERETNYLISVIF